MTYILIMGLLLGARHALDADHLAAVASLATRAPSRKEIVRLGVSWGVGHGVTLFAVGSAVILIGTAVPEHVARLLEFGVGIMLVVLGADVVRRLVRERVHVHVHRHADGTVHLHAHSHAGEPRHAHDPRRHEHVHAGGVPVRALLVGMMHGMAGSAALVLLTLGTLPSPILGVAYLVIFGVGATFGMAVLSLAISWPLRAFRALPRISLALQALVGAGTLALGASLVWRIGFVQGLVV